MKLTTRLHQKATGFRTRFEAYAANVVTAGNKVLVQWLLAQISQGFNRKIWVLGYIQCEAPRYKLVNKSPSNYSYKYQKP